MLEEMFLGIVVKDILELINVGFDFIVVNGIKIFFIGWVDVRVWFLLLIKEGWEVYVLFFVIIDCLEMLILGYNVIEELVKMDSKEGELILGFGILSFFKVVFVDGGESELKVLINFI